MEQGVDASIQPTYQERRAAGVFRLSQLMGLAQIQARACHPRQPKVKSNAAIQGRAGRESIGRGLNRHVAKKKRQAPVVIFKGTLHRYGDPAHRAVKQADSSWQEINYLEGVQTTQLEQLGVLRNLKITPQAHAGGLAQIYKRRINRAALPDDYLEFMPPPPPSPRSPSPGAEDEDGDVCMGNVPPSAPAAAIAAAIAGGGADKAKPTIPPAGTAPALPVVLPMPEIMVPLSSAMPDLVLPVPTGMVALAPATSKASLPGPGGLPPLVSSTHMDLVLPPPPANMVALAPAAEDIVLPPPTGMVSLAPASAMDIVLPPPPTNMVPLASASEDIMLPPPAQMVALALASTDTVFGLPENMVGLEPSSVRMVLPVPPTMVPLSSLPQLLSSPHHANMLGSVPEEGGAANQVEWEDIA